MKEDFIGGSAARTAWRGLLRVQLRSVPDDAMLFSASLVIFSHFLFVGCILHVQETKSNSGYLK